MPRFVTERLEAKWQGERAGRSGGTLNQISTLLGMRGVTRRLRISRREAEFVIQLRKWLRISQACLITGDVPVTYVVYLHKRIWTEGGKKRNKRKYFLMGLEMKCHWGNNSTPFQRRFPLSSIPLAAALQWEVWEGGLIAGLLLANWINKKRTKVHFPVFDKGEMCHLCLDVGFSDSPHNAGGKYKIHTFDGYS